MSSATLPFPAAGLPTQDQLRGWIERLETGLLERDVAVRAALLAALAGEHLLLIGPPGTAKSELARRLQHAFEGGRYFERLLTRFSVPEELFGPLSLKALEQDRYERLTEGYLPTASVAFLDEVFKANSAILNALLTLLNEREFDQGAGRVHTPLVCVVGATNDVPADDALRAFYDRFLLRVPVGVVDDASFDALMDLRDDAAHPKSTPRTLAPMALASIAALGQAAEAVDLCDEVRAALHGLRQHVRSLGLAVSDRRWRQVVRLLRVQAASLGRAQVLPIDLWLAPYALADTPEQVQTLQTWFVDDAMASPPGELPWLTRAVEAFEKQLEIETTQQQDDESGEGAGKIALARSIGLAHEDGGMTRFVSETLEAKLRKRYSPVHVQARVAQIDELLNPLIPEAEALGLRRRDLAQQVAGQCWLPPTTASILVRRVDDALQRVDALTERLREVRSGFAALPIDDALKTESPKPVALEA